MKVLHAPYTYYPAACGGTEVYVRSLIRELALLEVENQVVVPADKSGQDFLDGIHVHRLAMTAELTQAMLYGSGDPVSAAAFAQVLQSEKPDLVHFHAYSPAVSVRWLDAALRRGVPCVYTYHTPTLACARGTLMRWGSTPCDGEMRERRCAACALHGLGVSKPAALALTLLSPLTQKLNSRVPFRILPLVQKRSSAVRHWLSGMSRVIALCNWGAEVMKRNAVSAERLQVVRHGLAVQGWQLSHETRRHGEGEALKVGFFGRLDRTKGLQVLIEALHRKPELMVELHCHLIADPAAREALTREVRSDTRVFLHPPTPADEVVQAMTTYDAVLVPSIWLETGPLVVLEAFEAGVPVLGSDLGGIAEWVEHEKNGLLMPAGDTDAWSRGLERFCTDEMLRATLRAGVRPPPRMSAVAVRMLEIYHDVLRETSSE